MMAQSFIAIRRASSAVLCGITIQNINILTPSNHLFPTSVACEEEKREESHECPLCKMVKAGPCKHMFYPFEECLNSTDSEKQDVAAVCREPFTKMMECIHKFPVEYEQIMKEHGASSSSSKKGADRAKKSKSSNTEKSIKPCSHEGGKDVNMVSVTPRDS
jgi:hypothetical protein